MGHARARPAFPDSPFAAPRACGAPSVCSLCFPRSDTGPAPSRASSRSPLVSPGPTRPPSGRSFVPPAQHPAGRARKVPQVPRGRPVAPRRTRRTDGRSLPVTCGSERLPPNPRCRGRCALALLPLPVYPCAPSGPVWSRPEGPHAAPDPAQDVRPRPGRPACAIPVAAAGQGSDPGPVNSLSGGGQGGSERRAPWVEGHPRHPAPHPHSGPAAPDDNTQPARPDPRTPCSGPRLTCGSRAGSRCLGGSGSDSSRAAHGRPLQAAPRPTLSPPRPAARGNRYLECFVIPRGRREPEEPAREPGDSPSRAWAALQPPPAAPTCSPRLRRFCHFLLHHIPSPSTNLWPRRPPPHPVKSAGPGPTNSALQEAPRAAPTPLVPMKFCLLS